MPLLPDLSVYLVTDRRACCSHDLVAVVVAAIAGGTTIVQLRDKYANTRELLAMARLLKSALTGTGVPLLINDRADVALAAGADGLHIGQADLPYPDARRLMGPDAIIGLSLEHLKDAAEAASWDVNYVTAGPVFATTTKPDAGRPIGLLGLTTFRAATSHRLVAIGAITSDTAFDCIHAGADGVAVSAAICSSVDTVEAARLLRIAVTAARKAKKNASGQLQHGPMEEIFPPPDPYSSP